jgi:aminoglycoside 6'-N-acetyltransferase
VAYRSDPLVARYQTWDAPYSEADARLLLRMMQHITFGAPGEWYQIAVELKAEQVLIGDLAFHVTGADGRQGEFGVTFSRQYQGHGYATEALRRLFACAFEDLGLHRIIARLDTRNNASARLMERLGMRREAHFHKSFFIKGEWTDEYWYAILREEWQR